MNLITSSIYSALPFYISSLPLILLNLFMIYEKRNLLNLNFSSKEKIFMICFMLSILSILGITIGNNNPITFNQISLNNINLIPFKGIYMQYLFALKGDIYSIINLFGNIFVFIPFGFFLSLYYKNDDNKSFKILFIAIALSTVIEFLQLFLGRAADLTDIILNTFGVFLGKLFFQYIYIIFENFFKNINLSTKDNSNNPKIKYINLIQVSFCIIFLILNLI